MAQVATPTFSPTAGQVNAGATVTIACATAGSTIYYTFGDTPASTTNWTQYTDTVDLPADSGTTSTLRAFAIKSGSDDSEVASGTFYTIGFSAAVSASAKTVLDTAASQGLGAVCEGIAPTGSDGSSISGQRIGAANTTTDLKVETGAI
ncbi:MAG: hypothetical protein EBT13_16580 [Rhodobacteraceae bacterium]|nr:hypothetical protein [Paracoccaceae bacterium]